MEKINNMVRKFINSVAILLVSTFLVPLIIAIFFVWLLKQVFNIDLQKEGTKVKDKLDDISIDFNKVIIDEVNASFINRSDIKMSAKEYNTIEKALTAKLENKFNTEENLKKADDIALKQVWKIYEPLVNAVDSGYTLKVVFKN